MCDSDKVLDKYLKINVQQLIENSTNFNKYTTVDGKHRSTYFHKCTTVDGKDLQNFIKSFARKKSQTNNTMW